MIRCIAAIDNKHGLATDQGIPWSLPADKQYFRQQTAHGLLIMGYRTYQEFKSPLPGRQNFVVTNDNSPLRSGFTPIVNIAQFLENYKSKPVWIIGGAKLFSQTINFASELYLTQLEEDFHCTKFFPDYQSEFKLASSSEPKSQNEIEFRFEVWSRENRI